MPQIQFTDKATFGETRMTDEGFLETNAVFARAGIQSYLAIELGELFKDRHPLELIKVLRPVDEVLKSKDTFASKVVVNGHPDDFVTVDNASEVSVGFCGDAIHFIEDDASLKTKLTFTDANAISDIKSGKRALSAGYFSHVEREDGIFDGEKYDAVQKNIRGNHISLEHRARCGVKCSIKDKQTIPMKKVKIKDAEFEVAEDVAAAVESMAQELQAVKDGHASCSAAKDAIIAGLNTKIETADSEKALLQAQLDAAKASKISDADIAKLVQERAEVIAAASSICPAVDTTKSNIDIMRMVVKDKCPDVAGTIDTAHEVYVKGRFDALATSNGMGAAFNIGKKTGDKTTDAEPEAVIDSQAAREKYIADNAK